MLPELTVLPEANVGGRRRRSAREVDEVARLLYDRCRQLERRLGPDALATPPGHPGRARGARSRFPKSRSRAIWTMCGSVHMSNLLNTTRPI